MKLKDLLDSVIKRGLTMSYKAKKKPFSNRLHSNVIIVFALKLSVYVSKISGKQNIGSNRIISQIFSDYDADRIKQHLGFTDGELTYFFATHRLQTFIYFLYFISKRRGRIQSETYNKELRI